MNAKDLKRESDSREKRELGWIDYLVAIGYPLPAAFVLFCVFDIIFLGLGSVFGLVMMILTVVVYLLVVFFLLHIFQKPAPPLPSGTSVESRTAAYGNNPDSESEVASSFAAGMLGGLLLGRAISKHKSADK